MHNKIFTASIWSILTEIIAKVIGPLGFLILTRILSPEDFGVVAIATTILGFVYVISDIGIGKVIVQERGEHENLIKTYNAGFWFNAILGLCLYVLMVIFSKKLSELFNEPKSSAVIAIMAIQIIFYSLSSVQNAIKRKNLDFKFLFFLRLITVSTPVFISIPFAIYGYGYWAIVWGQVIGAFLNTLVLWITSTWKPILKIELYYLKNILSKSIWNTLEQIFIWIPIALDTYLISRYLNSYNLGIYSTSRTLFSTAISLSLAAILPVLFSAFSNIKEDSVLFRKAILFAQKIIFSLAAFMGTGVYIFKDLIETIIFTNKWQGISNIFGVIFLVLSFEYFYAAIIEALRAKGYFYITSINTIASVIITIPFLFLSIEYGLYIYVLVRTIFLYLCSPAIFHYSNKLLNVSLLDCLGNTRNTLFCTLSILALGILFSRFNFQSITLNILNFVSFALFFLIYIRLEINNLLPILRKVLSK